MFSGLQRDSNPVGLCVSAAVLYQLSYEDPYMGSRLICGIHCTRERNETYEYYVHCRHTNEMMWSSQFWLRFKQLQSKPENCFPLLDHNPYIVRSRCRRSQSNKKTNKNTNTWERCKSTEPFPKGFYLFQFQFVVYQHEWLVLFWVKFVQEKKIYFLRHVTNTIYLESCQTLSKLE